MAAAELIATAATAASSSDQTVAAGATLVLAVKGADDRALAIIELKDDGGAYIPIRNLSRQEPAWQVVGPATYRVRRVAGGSCGVFSA